MPLGVDDLTLGIHHVIVFQNILSGTEVAAFHTALCIFHRVGQNLSVNGCILIQTQHIHNAHHPIRREQTHQIVLQAQVEVAFTGITLTTGTAAKLIVDTTGFVALGADDEQTAGIPYLLCLFRHFGSIFFKQPFVLGTQSQNLCIVRLGIGICLL